MKLTRYVMAIVLGLALGAIILGLIVSVKLGVEIYLGGV